MWVNGVIIIATLYYCKFENEQNIGKVASLWGNGKYNSQQWFDIWSLHHFIIGMVFEKFASFLFKKEYAFVMFVAIACAFEILEGQKRHVGYWNESNYFGDSIINVFTDIVVAILGYGFAKQFNLLTGIMVIICLYLLFRKTRPILFKPTKGKKPLE